MPIKTIKELLKEAQAAFFELMKGLWQVRQERHNILIKAKLRDDAKKLDIIKQRINDL